MNTNDHQKLFSPVQIGPITLSHRVVMARSTRSRSDCMGLLSNPVKARD
jgi:2,4-dienoyl-CoA reductase-like NADH-dependent reductase (Old Yellow Enzyme family)